MKEYSNTALGMGGYGTTCADAGVSPGRLSDRINSRLDSIIGSALEINGHCGMIADRVFGPQPTKPTEVAATPPPTFENEVMYRLESLQLVLNSVAANVDRLNKIA